MDKIQKLPNGDVIIDGVQYSPKAEPKKKWEPRGEYWIGQAGGVHSGEYWIGQGASAQIL